MLASKLRDLIDKYIKDNGDHEVALIVTERFDDHAQTVEKIEPGEYQGRWDESAECYKTNPIKVLRIIATEGTPFSHFTE
jgi:hypothetical protein